MDRSRLPGMFCLLSLLLCGCNDPGFDLRRAAYDGNAAAVEKILKAHPELVNDREKPMPVRVVGRGAPRASTEWVDKLFAAKDNEFSSWNQSGMTPLHLAVGKEREEMVKLLLRHQAEANATNFYGWAALFDAAWRDKPALATLLLDAKADPNFKDRYGRTPLHGPAMNGKTNSAELLLKRGAPVNPKDILGMTPLHYAARRGEESMVRLLLLHRATIDDRDVRGNTPLNYATEFGQTNVIKLLLENGAEVNAVNNEGLSPLFQVVQNNPYRLGTPQRLALIDFLLANKAQVNVTNLFGTTLFQAALRAGNTEVINRLRQQGAKE